MGYFGGGSPPLVCQKASSPWEAHYLGTQGSHLNTNACPWDSVPTRLDTLQATLCLSPTLYVTKNEIIHREEIFSVQCIHPGGGTECGGLRNFPDIFFL